MCLLTPRGEANLARGYSNIPSVTGNHTSNWGAVSGTQSRMSNLPSGTLSYDVESGRPSIVLSQEPVQEKKKSNACCIWLCVIGAIVAILLFCLVFFWKDIFGTSGSTLSDAAIKDTKTKLKAVETRPDSSYSVHADPATHKAPGHKVQNNANVTSSNAKLAAMTNKAEFWACNGQCKSLFEGNQTHKVDPEKLMRRKKNLVAKGKNKKLCVICMSENSDHKSGRGRDGEDIGCESSDEMGATGGYKRARAINKLLKEGVSL